MPTLQASKVAVIVQQIYYIGARSTLIILLVSMFTGMVLALQGYYGLRKFGGESLLGAGVALSMTRELGPVLTALMVAARAGSAMAALTLISTSLNPMPSTACLAFSATRARMAGGRLGGVCSVKAT